MTADPSIEEARRFIAEMRRTGAHLGLDPEFTALESLLMGGREARLVWLRENIDRFYFGRGFKVLERLQAAASKQGNQALASQLEGIGSSINKMFKGQFLFYPDGVQLPQSDMLREMIRLINENRADDVLASMDKNLEHLEGHFFMILCEAMRNARSRGEMVTYEVLLVLGRTVAQKLLARELPCSFAFLFAP